MAGGPDARNPTDALPRRTGCLATAAAVAAVAALLRRPDGASLLPPGLSLALQGLALLAWVVLRCRHAPTAGDRSPGGCAHRRPDAVANRWITAALVVAAAAIAIARGHLTAFFSATTVFICGAVLVDTLAVLYRRVDDRIDSPRQTLRTLLGPWAMLILIATLLLALPPATRSSVPDYRHNLRQHVLNSAFAAVSTGCLIGTTVYHPGEDYTLFGQIVLFITLQLAGAGFAAVGLATVRPFLRNAIRLRTVLITAFVLQAVVIAATADAWSPADAPARPDRLWFGCVHAAGAMWNAGLMLRANGLEPYLTSGPVFIGFTTLAIAGSLGLPIILDILRGRRGSGTNEPDAAAARPWQRLPQWEAGGAFVLLIGGAAVLWVCETPHMIRESLSPTRPVAFGQGQVALRDDMWPADRWSLSVFVSVAARSAGLQSIPVSQGALSWPSYDLLLAWMIIGGSAGGTAGGMRTTLLLLPAILLIARRKAWSARTRDTARTIVRRVLSAGCVWLVINALAVAALAFTTDGDAYELAFDGVAALNGVGLTTGLLIHLTPFGRVVMMLIMLAGRLVPVLFWSDLAERLRQGRAPKDARRTAPE
ncbi:MAG: potassium transporter TrkG [Phycisphaerae bacterium]